MSVRLAKASESLTITPGSCFIHHNHIADTNASHIRTEFASYWCKYSFPAFRCSVVFTFTNVSKSSSNNIHTEVSVIDVLKKLYKYTIYQHA